MSATTIAQLHAKRIWVMAKGYLPDEGGMQTYARAVAEQYAAAGGEVTVFTRTSRGPRDVAVGPVRVVDVGPGKGIGLYLRIASALRRELRQQGVPALLHATTWRTSIVPMLLGLQYITTFHGREFMYPKGFKRRLLNAVARRTQRAVAVSHFTAAALQKRMPGLAQPPLVAWNGITPGYVPRADRSDSGMPLVLSLCRLEPRKNLLAAVRAAATCRDEGLAFRFVLAGRGEQFDLLRQAVADLRLEGVVELAGFVDSRRAVQLYQDADIFIHPHVTRDAGRDFEGFGIAVADAMYVHTAVIVGRAGGAPELVDDGESGLLVDGEDQASVTAALRRLLTDPALRASLAHAAAARAAREFSWQRHIASILAGLPPGLIRH